MKNQTQVRALHGVLVDAEIPLRTPSGAAPIIGTLPAYLDPTFGDRIQAQCNPARLLRALHRNRENFPPTWRIAELGALLAVSESALAECSSSALTARVHRLCAFGCVEIVKVKRNRYRYALAELPPVDVRIDATPRALTRIAAWLAYGRSIQGGKFHVPVTTSDVLRVLATHGIPCAKLGSAAVGAIRGLVASDPSAWRLSLSGREGRVGVTMGEQALAPDAQSGSLPERLLPIVRSRAASSVPPMFCLSDLTTQELQTLLPEGADPRGPVRSALSILSRGSARALVDLGVFGHRRWFSLPENVAVAGACLALQRAEATMKAAAREVRMALRCVIDQVRCERISEIERRLADAQRAIDGANMLVDAKNRAWMSTATHQVSRHIDSIQRTIATAPKAGVNASSTPANDCKPENSSYSWTELVSLAQTLAEHWENRTPGKALATRVVKRARRIELVEWEEGTAGRIGAAGRYHAFEARALLLTFVADRDTRSIARRALRKLGACPSHPAVLKGLMQPEIEARLLAAMGLGILGGGHVLDTLIRAAREDKEAGVREISVWALSMLAPARAEDALASGLLPLQGGGQNRMRSWVERQSRSGGVPWSAAASRYFRS